MDLKLLEGKMQGAIGVLEKELAGIRTGRPSPLFLDPVKVESHGVMVPINAVGNIMVQDSKTLLVQLWDKGLIKATEKGIRDANLGVSVRTDNNGIFVGFPEMSEERRKEMVKLSQKNAENTRIAIRNLRRDFLDHLKTQEKSKAISEDENKKMTAEVQKIVDKFIIKVDDMIKVKEKEIMKV